MPDSTFGAGFREVLDSWLLHPWERDWPGRVHNRTSEGEGYTEPRWRLDLASGRLFSLPELNQSAVGGAFRLGGGGKIRVRGSCQVLGNGPYRHQTWKAGVILGRVRRFGINFNKTRQYVAKYKIDGSWQAVFAAEIEGVLPGNRLGLLSLQLPLTESLEPGDIPARREFLQARIWQGDWGLALQLDRRPDGSPVAGFEIMWAGVVAVSLRMDPSTGTLGPGIQIRRGPLVVRTSHLVHPYLGQTHRVGLTLVPVQDD